MKHPSEEQLSAYVDGERDASTEAHVRDCVDCRRTIDALRSIVSEAGNLGELTPPRDLFPEIREAVTPASKATPWRSIAAVAAIVVVGLIGFAQWRTTETESSGATIEDLVARFEEAERAYLEATEMLVARLEEQRDSISPETLAVLDRNLEIVDAAIAEVRATREGVEDERTLAALYDKKLQLLWQASRLSS